MYSSMGNMECIWMNSCSIDYKICDNNFDCYSCPFDKKMRAALAAGKHPDTVTAEDECSDLIKQTIDKIAAEKPIPQFHYFSNYIYLKNLFADKYYIGISPIISHLIDDVEEVNICNGNKSIKRGETIVSISGKWGDVHIAAPVDFFCLGKANHKQQSQELTKWISLIEADSEGIENFKIPHNQFNEQKDVVIDFLSSFILDVPNIGETMYDGAQKANHVYELTGKESFTKFVQLLFNAGTNV